MGVLSVVKKRKNRLGLSRSRSVVRALTSHKTDVGPLGRPSINGLRDILRSRTFSVLFFDNRDCDSPRVQSNRLILGISGSTGNRISDRRYSLRALQPDLVDTGRGKLGLSVFGSYSNLKLTSSLTNLRVPFDIIFERSIPSRITVRFLEAFLSGFSGKRLLCPSLETTHGGLHGLSSRCPTTS